jgi:hypothetical protein
MQPAAHIERLRQQLDTWLRLAEAIERSQRALLQGDLAEIERSTKNQAECCHPCRETQLARSEAITESESELFTRIEQARQRVRHQNRVHAELLRRANRSLRILRHLLTGGAAYGPPQTPDQPLLPGERG